MFKKITSALLFIIAFQSYSQNIDTTSKELSPVEILTEGSKSRTQMPEVHGAIIYAGKKNEVIKPNKLNADLSINSTRQLFGRIPGIHIWENDGTGIQTNVATRGLSPNRSWEFNVRQNGYDISSEVFGYPEAYYAPPAEAVERIEVLRGASSLAYGPQVGGALNYILKKGPKDKVLEVEARHTIGSYGLNNTFVGLGGTKNRLSYYGYIQQRSMDGWRENSRFNTYTVYGSLQYQINNKMTIGAEYTNMDYRAQQAGGLTDAQFKENARQSSRERNWFGTPWNVAALTFDYKINSKNEINIKAFGVLAERNSVGFTSAITTIDSAQFNRTVDRDFYENIGLEARYRRTYGLFGKDQTLTAGVRYYQGNTIRRQRGTGTPGAAFDLSLTNPVWGRDMDFTTTNASVFAENALFIGKNFVFTQGLRYEYINNTSSGYTTLSNQQFGLTAARERNVLVYGIGAEYHLGKHSEIYANASTSYRPVMFADITPSATTEVIDENLQDASAMNADLGFRGSVKGLAYDLGVFYLQYDNRIGRITENGINYVRNLGTTETMGAEIYVEWNPFRQFNLSERTGDLEFFVSSAILQAEYTRWDNPAADANPALSIVGNKVENAPEQVHRAGVSYSFKKFNLTYQFNSVSEVFTDANNTETPTANAQAGKIDGYTLSDLTVSFRPSVNYVFSAGVNNLFDERYATRRAGGYPGPGLLPGNARTFFMTVGVKF